MLLGGSGRHLCPAPDVQNLLPGTGSLPGTSATLSVDVTDGGTAGIKEVRFYWWKYDHDLAIYYDQEFIDTDTTGSGGEYSVTWTFPSCGEYDPQPGGPRVAIQAIAESNCGAASDRFGDDRLLDGRGC